MAAGTGAAFALLPSQNASGNWIKVVQRVPVRIALDPKELAERPLRIGLSMQVKVDIARDEGTSLTTSGARTTPAYETRVFDAADRDADAEIARIIAANSAVNSQASAKQ
jgi:membrane fusion protein (multidrug efflux system)